MADERPEVATKAPVDHLEQARAGRALVDRLGDEYDSDPTKFMATGVNVGGMQRTYLHAAAVDALIAGVGELQVLGAAVEHVGGIHGQLERLNRNLENIAGLLSEVRDRVQ